MVSRNGHDRRGAHPAKLDMKTTAALCMYWYRRLSTTFAIGTPACCVAAVSPLPVLAVPSWRSLATKLPHHHVLLACRIIPVYAFRYCAPLYLDAATDSLPLVLAASNASGVSPSPPDPSFPSEPLCLQLTISISVEARDPRSRSHRTNVHTLHRVLWTTAWSRLPLVRVDPAALRVAAGILLRAWMIDTQLETVVASWLAVAGESVLLAVAAGQTSGDGRDQAAALGGRGLG